MWVREKKRRARRLTNVQHSIFVTDLMGAIDRRAIHMTTVQRGLGSQKKKGLLTIGPNGPGRFDLDLV